MSVSAYGTAGFGYLFSKSGINAKITYKPSCDHTERAENKFCPECGVKVEDVKSTNKADIIAFIEYLECTNVIEKIGLCRTRGTYDTLYFIGWSAGEETYPGADGVYSADVKNIPSQEEIDLDIRHALKDAIASYPKSNFGGVPLNIDENFIDQLIDWSKFGFHQGVYLS